jgi:hypothetical protein
LRFNLFEGKSKIYDLVLEENGKKLWIAHPNEKIDIAIIPINVHLLKKDKIQYTFFPEEIMHLKTQSLTRAFLREIVFLSLDFQWELLGKNKIM